VVRRGFFLTWGRIQDRVDPEPVCALVLRAASGNALGGELVDARLCFTLKDAAESGDAPYFYECFVGFVPAAYPQSRATRRWRQERAEAMGRCGKEIWLLRPNPRRGSRACEVAASAGRMLDEREWAINRCGPPAPAFRTVPRLSVGCDTKAACLRYLRRRSARDRRKSCVSDWATCLPITRSGGCRMSVI